MADYSGFKIKRPHSLAPFTSVYEAEAVDGRAGRFALKIFHPPASTQVRRFYAIEGWLLAAARQQQSAKKDGAVVGVVAFGRCEEGAFMVMPWQERFLEPWIKTLGAKGDTLRALAECLLNTIEKWEKETGGPHGNLKASNVFLDRAGPLVGMTATLSDPAYLPGASAEALRLADLAAVGTMLATIVRRRPPGAWPIEEAPEWKALGKAGKGWLDFCNYLLNPQPGEGEVTLAKARLRLKKIPKDANAAKSAALTLAAVLTLSGVALVVFARFGNPVYMPDQIERLAIKLGNPQTLRSQITPSWGELCMAWDSWLGDLVGNGKRLLRTQGLMDENDELKAELRTFLDGADALRPQNLVPEARAENRLGVLAKAPPPEVLTELLTNRVATKVESAATDVKNLATKFDRWPRWEQLRQLQKRLEEKTFTQAAGALGPKLPPAPGTEGYKLDPVRTVKLFNDISLDSTGTLPLASRWGEISQLSADMAGSGDRIQKAMPGIILGRLQDKSSLSDFADSLEPPLEEMRQRRKEYLDPQVVRERYVKESDLQQGTVESVTVEDFPKWENELKEFTLVPKTFPADPRLAPELDADKGRMVTEAVDLEETAPPSDEVATLSAADFTRENNTLTANLKSLRDRAIVKRDLPAIVDETSKMAEIIKALNARLQATLILLRPESWLVKVRQPYGKFDETKQRWTAWQAIAVPASVLPEQLKGSNANRDRFKTLRAGERQVKEWIDGLEGPAGLGELVVPELGPEVSKDAIKGLQQLEAVFRQRAAAGAGTATAWNNNALPTTPWRSATAAMRRPLETHRDWLAAMPAFAKDLTELDAQLTTGIEWSDDGKGVKDVAARLDARVGVNELTGTAGSWYNETKALHELYDALPERGVLVAAAQAQSVGLSRKLSAWRRLAAAPGWPAGAPDFDLDLKVVNEMRKLVASGVKDDVRRIGLLDDFTKGTKQRFNRAARAASRAETEARADAELTAMFNASRMTAANVVAADLDGPVAFNFAWWKLKKADRNGKSLDVLGAWRDAFVKAVEAIEDPAVRDNENVKALISKLNALDLKDTQPARVQTQSPATVGWNEEPTDEGLGMTATWRGAGGRTVRLDYKIVQPVEGDDTPPFYLAVKAIAVGEFVDLMTRPEAVPVKAALPGWTRNDASSSKPYNMAFSWQPSDGKGFELNSSWVTQPDATVAGLLADTALRATNPALEQAAAERPTPRSPLQQVSPTVAKLFTEKLLGARLPTVKEWQAVMRKTNAQVAGAHFRAPNFQKLFQFVRDYRVVVNAAEGTTNSTKWRPNDGAFMKDAPGGDAPPSANTDESRIWFRSVDDGPKSGDFINLLGNISIFLAGDTPAQFFVAGGSVMSTPTIDFTQPQKAGGAASALIGGRATEQAYTDVGIRPAFDAPPGFKERYALLMLVKNQKYLTL